MTSLFFFTRCHSSKTYLTAPTATYVLVSLSWMVTPGQYMYWIRATCDPTVRAHSNILALSLLVSRDRNLLPFSLFQIPLPLYNVLDRLCGQSFWLQIQMSRVRFPALPYFLRSRGGMERGPLSLATTIEELLEWKSSGSGLEKQRLTAVGIRCADHATTYSHKGWH
jgi:hypothetical protein